MSCGDFDRQQLLQGAESLLPPLCRGKLTTRTDLVSKQSCAHKLYMTGGDIVGALPSVFSYYSY